MPTAGQFIRAADFPAPANASSSTDELGFTNTTFGPGTTTVGVSFVAATSGRAKIDYNVLMEANTANHVVVSVTTRAGGVIGSGTSFQSASLDEAIYSSNVAGQDFAAAGTRYLSGLAAGSTYNSVIEFRMDAAGNGDIFYRSITVAPLP